MPFRMLLRSLAGKFIRVVRGAYIRFSDYRRPTYSDRCPPGALYSCMKEISLDNDVSFSESLAGISQRYLEHRFDLLGSGWVQVTHGMRCRGLEGYRYDMGTSIDADPEGKWLKEFINAANIKKSTQVWKEIFVFTKCGYVPIDWQLDFKSGYRWKETTWYRDIRYGHKDGVDVKVPWELSRMQHLPQLALSFALSLQQERDSAVKFVTSEEYASEFRSQVLDFIATNPPRFGVNWNCTMDVAIRVSNWLVAYDLFKAYGKEWDCQFERIFIRSVYEHGLHIIRNLEWNPETRGNHYLANIVGLLFVAAYLPRNDQTDAWLSFAVQELIKETELQFNSDGTNFEASTSYHRLSAEMVVYATALVLGLPAEKYEALESNGITKHHCISRLLPGSLTFYPQGIMSGKLHPFPPWYLERLEKMAEFTMHITKPDHHIPQIGDNDNGRFLRMHSIYHKRSVVEAKSCYANLDGYDALPDQSVFWDEDHLDHRGLISAIDGLFEREDFGRFCGGKWVDFFIIRCLSRNSKLISYRDGSKQSAAELVRVDDEHMRFEIWKHLQSSTQNALKKLEIKLPGKDTIYNLKTYAYCDFGLYLFRSNGLYAAIRCGPLGQNGNGGHAHNDCLSLELWADGRDIIYDKGTYLYTPLPKRRNQYRSVAAHFAPRMLGHEPGNLDIGLFTLPDQFDARCVFFSEREFIGRHEGYGSPVYRIFQLQNDCICIIDYAESGDHLNDISRPESGSTEEYPFSPGYGILHAKSPLCCI